MMTDLRPTISCVLETVLYVSDLERSERFYCDVLGLRLMGKESGRSLFFRAGSSVFLLFMAEVTRRGDSLPAHGAVGPVHSCFLVPEAEYEQWKEYLPSRGVTILQEVEWQRGRSFYFQDPDGNVLEIANADFWPN